MNDVKTKQLIKPFELKMITLKPIYLSVRRRRLTATRCTPHPSQIHTIKQDTAVKPWFTHKIV